MHHHQPPPPAAAAAVMRRVRVRHQQSAAVCDWPQRTVQLSQRNDHAVFISGNYKTSPSGELLVQNE